MEPLIGLSVMMVIELVVELSFSFGSSCLKMTSMQPSYGSKLTVFQHLHLALCNYFMWAAGDPVVREFAQRSEGLHGFMRQWSKDGNGANLT